MCCNDTDGEDVETPYINYLLPWLHFPDTQTPGADTWSAPSCLVRLQNSDPLYTCSFKTCVCGLLGTPAKCNIHAYFRDWFLHDGGWLFYCHSYCILMNFLMFQEYSVYLWCLDICIMRISVPLENPPCTLTDFAVFGIILPMAQNTILLTRVSEVNCLLFWKLTMFDCNKFFYYSVIPKINGGGSKKSCYFVLNLLLSKIF